jgi:hypothetical protein
MFDVNQCLDRAAFCTRLAEREADPQLRQLFKNLAIQWMQAARDKQKDADKRSDVQ